MPIMPTTLAATILLTFLYGSAGRPALTAPSALAVQPSFEEITKDLSSQDRRVRLRATELLKDSAYPEAALPLAAVVTDPEDVIQLEAIKAELNIFLAEKIVEKKKVG